MGKKANAPWTEKGRGTASSQNMISIGRMRVSLQPPQQHYSAEKTRRSNSSSNQSSTTTADTAEVTLATDAN